MNPKRRAKRYKRRRCDGAALFRCRDKRTLNPLDTASGRLLSTLSYTQNALNVEQARLHRLVARRRDGCFSACSAIKILHLVHATRDPRAPASRGAPRAPMKNGAKKRLRTPEARSRHVAHTTAQRPQMGSINPRARHLSGASLGSGRGAREELRRAQTLPQRNRRYSALGIIWGLGLRA